MKETLLTADFAVFCGAVLVLIMVPVWIRWLCKREDTIYRSRRIVHTNVCELCSQSASFIAHIQFEAYEKRNPLMWERITYAASSCHDCAVETVQTVRRQNLRKSWLFIPGVLALALTWSNTRRAIRDYESRKPTHDDHPEYLADG